MSDWKAKRFWTDVSVRSFPDGYSIYLDDRELKTPTKSTLRVPTKALADEIAKEWHDQEGEIDPSKMPFTRSANSAIDKVRPQHGDVVAMLAEYGDTDLLCYRADSPAGLVERQSQIWDPLLDWAADALGARLTPQVGIMHKAQAARDLDQLRNRVAQLDEFELVAFHDLVGLSGSLIIGFAVFEGAHDPLEMWDASRVDELWQQDQWGVDDEAHAQSEHKKADFLHAVAFCRLSGAQ